jgi:hypothetical protein
VIDGFRGRLVAWREAVQHPVAAIGLGMVALQLVFRAWALYPSWFYTDDYRLLQDATGRRPDLSHLMEPFDSQFMPLGRLLAWLVADSGHVNWPLAATFTLVLQGMSGVACLWMLRTLFGARWGILAPLGLYLTSAVLVPAMMWWAASLNQLPWQLAFFGGVASWVHYLRSRRASWLVATLTFLAVGLLAYVKVVLIFGVLAYLVLAYFAAGGAIQRLRTALHRYWPAGVAAVALGGAFSAYYLTQVPQVFTESTESDAPVFSGLANTMIGDSLPTGIVGGPWRWSEANPPTGYADPPQFMVLASWVLIVCAALFIWMTRTRTGRAWGLFGGYTAAAFVLVLTSRAQIAGSLIGTEYRYLTDVAAVFVLASGLATMELRGAVESSARRDEPLIRIQPPPWVTPLVVTAICVSGIVSSASYSAIWHRDNPGATYVQNLQNSVDRIGRVELADQVVPGNVIPGFSYPYNTTHRLVPLLTDQASFPSASPRLAVLAEDGTVRKALIGSGTTNQPGPVPDCGYRISGPEPVTIPLRGRTFDWEWWVRIGYLSSRDSSVTIRAGSEEVKTEVEAGLHSVYVQLSGAYDSVTIEGLGAGTTMCVDVVEVGNPEPGGRL